MNKAHERQEILTPNSQRALGDAGQDPEQVRAIARRLLDEVSYASALYDPVTALGLTRNPCDREIWEEDLRAMQTLWRSANIERASVRDSVFAPLARALSRARVRTQLARDFSTAKDATRERENLKARVNHSNLTWLDYKTPVADWPKREDGQAYTPMEISLSTETGYAVFFNTYQHQAAALIEVVRAVGKNLGECDGDKLANRFQLMVLAYGGAQGVVAGDTEFHLAPLVDDDRLLDGGFLDAADDPCFETGFGSFKLFEAVEGKGMTRADSEPWCPLSGPDQHLAITILAAWLRMSTLGVRLGSWEALAGWRDFMKTTSYGENRRLIGIAYILSDKDAKTALSHYQRCGKWANPKRADQIPWFAEEGGAPLVFLGLVAELLRKATNKLGLLDYVSEGFVLPSADADASEMIEAINANSRLGLRDVHAPRFGNKKLIQLRRIYDQLTSPPQGCVKTVSLRNSYDGDDGREQDRYNVLKF